MGQDVSPNYGKLVFGLPLLNPFMVCYQKAFKRERNLNKMIGPWGTHMNIHDDVQQIQGALKTEGNLGINGGNNNVYLQVVQIKKIQMSQLLLLKDISKQVMMQKKSCLTLRKKITWQKRQQRFAPMKVMVKMIM